MINNLKTARTFKTGVKKKTPDARIKELAEAILLQSMEDLWIDEARSNCIDFFCGEGFHICSEMAGMSSDDKAKLLNMVGDITYQNSRKNKEDRGIRDDPDEAYELVR